MKKKFLTLVCAVCLCVVSLAGCGNKASEEGEAQKTETSVEKTTANESVASVSEKAEAGNASEQKEEKNEEPLVSHDYKNVLNEVYEYIHDFNFAEPAYDDNQYGLFENINYGAKERNAFEAVGYALKDLTGDGEPELLIIAPDYDYDPEGSAGSEVLNIYGYVNDEPALIMNGYARNSVVVLGDNTVLETASMSAFSTGIGVYKLVSGSTDKEIVEHIFSYAFEEDGYKEKYFTNNDESWDYEKAEPLDITEEDFWNKISEYENKTVVIDITLFKDYEYTGSKEYKVSDRKAEITGGWADDTMPSIPDYVDPAIDIYSWQGKPVVISTNTTVYDFTLWALELTDVDEEGNPVFYTADLMHMGDFTPEEDKLLLLEFMGDSPEFAVSYRESDGTFKRFIVQISGQDGSILLSEMN